DTLLQLLQCMLLHLGANAAFAELRRGECLQGNQNVLRRLQDLLLLALVIERLTIVWRMVDQPPEEVRPPRRANAVVHVAPFLQQHGAHKRSSCLASNHSLRHNKRPLLAPYCRRLSGRMSKTTYS